MAWLSGYSKRKELPLTGGSSGAQTDYPLKIAVSYEAAMQGDFDDIRFTQADGTTLIDAWAEVIVTDTSATIWVEFPTTPANTVEQDYYMYYGNTGAASDWSGVAVFDFFDEFEAANPSMWGKLIYDADQAYKGWLSLKDGSIYLSSYYDDTASTKTAYARPVLLYAVFLYELTGDQTYLDTAQQAADDLHTYAMNSTTKIVADWDWATNQQMTSGVHLRYQAGYLQALALIAHYNSSYLSIANDVRDGLINNYINANDRTYLSVTPSGSVSDTRHYSPFYPIAINALLRMYELHNDTTARDAALDIINATWALRNVSTDLIAESYNADTGATVRDDFREWDTAGNFLSCMEYAYFLTSDATIKQHIIDYSYAIAYYMFDSGTGTHGAFRYRTNTSGTAHTAIYEICFDMLDYALLIANDINANSTVYNNAKNDYDTMLTDGHCVDNNLCKHAVYADGSDYVNNQSLFQVANQLPLCAYKLYLATGTSSYLTTAKTFYDQLIEKHKRSTVGGYVTAINPYTFANDSFDPKLTETGLSFPSNAAVLIIKPSSTVSVKWWNNNEEPTPILGYSTLPAYFNKVHFDWKNKKITLDDVTGAGTIDFDVTSIVSAKKDGATYTDFTGTTLTTIAGSHSYEIVVTSEYGIQGLFPGPAWSITGTASETASSTEQSVSPTHSVKQTGSTGEHRGADGDMSSQQSGMHVNDFRIRFPQNDARTIAFISSDTAAWPATNAEMTVFIVAYSDGNIKYYDTAWHTIDSYAANQWYHWEIILKPATKKFDMKIDGVSKVTDGNFRGTEITPRYVHLHNRQESTGIFYFDDFIVRKYATGPPTYAFGSEESEPTGSPYWYYNMLRRRN